MKVVFFLVLLLVAEIGFAKKMNPTKINEIIFDYAIKKYNQAVLQNTFEADQNLSETDRQWLNKNPEFLKTKPLPFKKISSFEIEFTTSNQKSARLKFEPEKSLFLLNNYPLDFESRSSLKDRSEYIERVLKFQKYSRFQFLLETAQAEYSAQKLTDASNLATAITNYINGFNQIKITSFWDKSISDKVAEKFISNYQDKEVLKTLLVPPAAKDGVDYLLLSADLSCGGGNQTDTEHPTCGFHTFKITRFVSTPLDVTGREVEEKYYVAIPAAPVGAPCSDNRNKKPVMVTSEGEPMENSDFNTKMSKAIYDCCGGSPANSNNSAIIQSEFKKNPSCISRLIKDQKFKESRAKGLSDSTSGSGVR